MATMRLRTPKTDYVFYRNLIDLVRQTPQLWNDQLPDHKDTSISEANWRNIATKLRCGSYKVVQIKWRNLRDSYVKKLRHLPPMDDPNYYDMLIYMQKWAHFNALQFLNGVVQPKKFSKSKDYSVPIIYAEGDEASNAFGEDFQASANDAAVETNDREEGAGVDQTLSRKRGAEPSPEKRSCPTVRPMLFRASTGLVNAGKNQTSLDPTVAFGNFVSATLSQMDDAKRRRIQLRITTLLLEDDVETA